MLKKIMKWTARILLLIVLLVLGYYTKAWITTDNRRNKQFSVKPVAIELVTDSAIIAQGKRLVAVKGCDDCHGKDLSGRTIFEKSGVGRLVAKNITRGQGGLRSGFTARDWVLAIRHGLGQDGKPLLYMPSVNYNQLTEPDLKAIIAYCAQVPPVDNQLPLSEIGPGATILTDLGQLGLFAAEKIDHAALPPAGKEMAETAEFGKYVALVCTHCHQPNMKGGGPNPDISSTGKSSQWTDEQFFHALRTGIRPDGSTLKEPMPWKMTREFSDVELKAVRLYLKSI